MAITQTITSLPDAPERSDPDNFSDKSDAFLAGMEDMPDELNTWASQANSLASDMEDLKDDAETAKTAAETAQAGAETAEGLAEDYKDAAASLANATVYSATATYNGGDVVQDPDDSYALYVSQADSNTGHTPNADDGTWWEAFDKKWERTEVTSSTDITLTSSSTKIQAINMTASGKSVILPDATTLDLGIAFLLSSVGESFDVIDGASGGVYAFSSTQKNGVLVVLSDNSSVGGQWSIIDLYIDNIFIGVGTVFESDSLTYISVAALSSTQAIVCYRDGGNSGYGTACILDISGGTITAGVPVVFDGSSQYFSVSTLSSAQAVVCYQDVDNSYYGTACILDISGSTITAGTPVVFESADSSYISSISLSSNQAIVCYKDSGNSGYGTACILDISGSTITAGTPVVFESAVSNYVSMTSLSSTQAVVCYQDVGNSYYGTACILDISGSTITAGTPVVFESAYTIYISVSALSSNQAIVCYKDSGNSGYGTACILDISGSTITAGTPVVFESAISNYVSMTSLSSTQAVVCYQDVGNSSYGTACILDISGSTITAGTPVVFESAQVDHISAASLTSSRAIVCYRDYGNSYYGTTRRILT